MRLTLQLLTIPAHFFISFHESLLSSDFLTLYNDDTTPSYQVVDHICSLTELNIFAGVGRTIKNIVEPDYGKLRENLEAAGASKSLMNECHKSMTSSQIKDLYGSYAHCFIGTLKRKRYLDLIFILKHIMLLLMARYGNVLMLGSQNWNHTLS